MPFHPIQTKILELSARRNLAGLTLRKIGELIGEKGSPQKIKHHVVSLKKKGLLVTSADGTKITRLSHRINPSCNLLPLPIYGRANCGEALELASDYIKDYLKVSKKILSPQCIEKVKDIFVLEAAGHSMNRANVNGKTIEDGDYVLALKAFGIPQSGEYVISIIDGAANIKKFYKDDANKQIVLLSESTSPSAPIYVHEDDISEYVFCGRVVDVLKQPDELEPWRQAAFEDMLKDLGPISKKEVEYYENI